MRESMKAQSVGMPPHAEPSDWSILARCALTAAAIEFIALTLAGTSNHWMVHSQKNKGLDESRFVEAQVLTIPKQSHLVSETPQVPSAHHEAEISKQVGQGRKAKADEKPLTDSNQTKTEAGEPLPPSHGPVAFYTPSPVIPSYLQTQELNASVVIEFLVTGLGVVTPRLLASSGNEELDAIALNTARQWQFRPAENNHVAMDAKVRLRILFEVK